MAELKLLLKPPVVATQTHEMRSCHRWECIYSVQSQRKAGKIKCALSNVKEKKSREYGESGRTATSGAGNQL